LRNSVSVLGVLLCATAGLAGCGIGTVATSSAGSMAIQGKVHGGQQPVSNSSIQLYTVGSGGNGSAAIAMLPSGAVTSDDEGHFSITGDYACGESNAKPPAATGSNQVYIVATGGNPGLKAGTYNHSLIMMATLGDCSKLSDTTYIDINEVTTVAAAWALAPFITSYNQVGASATNVAGIQNAFLDAALIADTRTGMAAILPQNLAIETDKLYALADAIASCVNSDGTTGCGMLFTAATPSGETKPTDTLTAALNIVKNPGQNVAAVFNAIGEVPPFVTGLMNAPNDWTMSLTISGGGLDEPTDLAIDAENNVWVAEYGGPLSVFGPQGAPLSATGFGAGDIAQAFAVAVDSVGDIWVTNYNGGGGHDGNVTEFMGTDATPPNQLGDVAGNYQTGILYPDALSADTNGNIFIANHDSSSATEYNSSGALVYAGLGSGLGLDAKPLALAVDVNDGFWLSGNDNTIAHISAPNASYPNGQLLSEPTCCYESYGLATDKDGTVWVADYHGGPLNNGAFTKLVTDAHGKVTAPIDDSTVGGINHPAFVVIDAGQNVWISNVRGASISEIAGGHIGDTVATALSPTTGTYGIGGYGLDASLLDPIGIAPDRSGNVWVCNGGVTNEGAGNAGSSTLVMFFGLATPTATPVQPVPTAP